MSRRRFLIGFRRRPRPTIEPPPPERPFRTDAWRGRGAARPEGVAPDPEDERRERLRFHVSVFLLVSLFLFGCLAAVFGERGLLDLRRSAQQLRTLELQTEREQRRVAGLRGHVQRLRDDPAALERIAREELGLTRPGEVVFLLPREKADPDDPDAPPASR